jgi:broad specificity phosphatase PhoE
MSIYLIRHGETASNRARIVQWPDTPLSERGIAQARLLGRRLADVGITRIVTSDMQRAHMTAAPIEEATGVPLSLDPDLRERFFGDHCGTPYEELTQRGHDIFAPDHEPPNGESWAAFHARVDRAWENAGKLAASIDGHLAIVTHGLVCHSITARLVETHASLDPGSYGRDGPPIRFGNTAVSVLTGPLPWRFELFACTAHLDDAVADDGTALSGI